MLDIGWTELLVIAVILIVVVGPKDLPPMIRAFGKMTKRLRQTAGEFRAQFDEALREAELDDLKNSVNDIRSLNPANSLRETLNPLRQMGQEIKSDLERSTRPDAKPVASDDGYEEHSILPDVPLGLGEPPKELNPVTQPAAATPVSPPAAAVASPVIAATAPATSAPVSAPAVEKKPAPRKPAAKKAAPAKSEAKPAKASAATPVSTEPPIAATTKPKAVVAKKTAAKTPAPAKAKAAAAPEAPAKATPRTRKTKSEDRA